MKIFKYKLDVTDVQSIKMPWDARILTVQIQDNEPHIWAVVDDTSPGRDRTFLVIGTGNEFTANPRDIYIGTFQQTYRYGTFVGHVFERV